MRPGRAVAPDVNSELRRIEMTTATKGECAPKQVRGAEYFRAASRRCYARRKAQGHPYCVRGRLENLPPELIEKRREDNRVRQARHRMRMREAKAATVVN